MILLEPIKFKPIYKERIWGSDRLSSQYGKNFPNDICIGESWEISDVDGDLSLVEQGCLEGRNIRDIIKEYKGKLVGGKVYKKFKDSFPLLIKLIDTMDNLSIQVHPDDDIAKHRHNLFGKTEMWYVMDSKEHSKIIIGFNRDVDKKTYINSLDNKNLVDILNFESVDKGDVFYVPAGRIHAIGKDIVLAEIQQKSDITYRVYDWDRVDSNGISRQLHIKEALDVIDYNSYDKYKTQYSKNTTNKEVDLVDSKYFNTKIININKDKIKMNYVNIDSFVIYICVEGNLDIEINDRSYQMFKGETLLLPAAINEVALRSEYSKLLQVYLD